MSNPFTVNGNIYTATQPNIDLIVTKAGTFTLDGISGNQNTLELGTSLRSNYHITQLANGSVQVDSLSAASGGALLHATLNDIQILTFNSGADVLNLTTYFGTPTPPPTPTYGLSATTPSVNEGSHDSITLTTTNVAAGTIETYAISGIAANRLNSGTLTGQVTLDASGKAVIDLGVIANNHTDGSATATITIGSNLASTSVTVNDTSLSPAPTQNPNPTPTETGTAGNDIFHETTGNTAIDGLAGINTVVYTGNQSGYTLTVNSNGTETVHKASGGTDTLTNIQRLQFADTKIAFDINGNAGTAAKILGAVLGAAAVSNPTYEGIALGLLDGGMSYANLMHLAFTAVGANSSNAVVTTLLTNVLGTTPTPAQVTTFSSLIDNGTYTDGTLGVLAADYNANNTNHINLVGLQATGIHYV